MRRKESCNMKTIPLLMITATLSMNAGGDVFKEIIEKKYDSPLERFDLISFSATTKILRFDSELTEGKGWWGTFNVIEVKKDGTPCTGTTSRNPHRKQVSRVYEWLSFPEKNILR